MEKRVIAIADRQARSGSRLGIINKRLSVIDHIQLSHQPPPQSRTMYTPAASALAISGDSHAKRDAQLSWRQLLLNNPAYFRSNLRLGPPPVRVLAHLATKPSHHCIPTPANAAPSYPAHSWRYVAAPRFMLI